MSPFQCGLKVSVNDYGARSCEPGRPLMYLALCINLPGRYETLPFLGYDDVMELERETWYKRMGGYQVRRNTVSTESKVC